MIFMLSMKKLVFQLNLLPLLVLELLLVELQRQTLMLFKSPEVMVVQVHLHCHLLNMLVVRGRWVLPRRIQPF